MYTIIFFSYIACIFLNKYLKLYLNILLRSSQNFSLQRRFPTFIILFLLPFNLGRLHSFRSLIYLFSIFRTISPSRWAILSGRIIQVILSFTFPEIVCCKHVPPPPNTPRACIANTI